MKSIIRDDLFNRVNGLFTNMGLGLKAIAPNGEPYVELMAGGIKEEGGMCPGWYRTEDQAIDGWWRAFCNYTSEYSDPIYKKRRKKGVVYWSAKPELGSAPTADIIEGRHGFFVESDFDGDRVFTVYACLCISEAGQI